MLEPHDTLYTSKENIVYKNFFSDEKHLNIKLIQLCHDKKYEIHFFPLIYFSRSL